MDFFRKMSFADSTGDAIPFYHEGKYHIFSLTSPPGTTVYPARLRTTWSHSVSEDLVHWKELPTALYPGDVYKRQAGGDVHLLTGCPAPHQRRTWQDAGGLL